MPQRLTSCFLLFFFLLFGCQNNTAGHTPKKEKESGNSSPADATAAEAQALLANKNCKTCHNKNIQGKGPSYTDIAGRYETTEKRVYALVQKVQKGGSGVWGNQVMTPHPDVPLSDLEKMVRYILSLDEPTQDADPPNNTLTPKEIKEGWTLLFDGTSLNGWRNYKKQSIGKSWVIDDAAIHLSIPPEGSAGRKKEEGGDIITSGTYGDFEFSYDWKIGPCGNSGVMFHVAEDEKYRHVWETGPEMQVLDNACHPDAKITTHQAGDLYDMIACSKPVVKPAGEWNKARIICHKGAVSFWLNGEEVVAFTMYDEAWQKRIAKSKFKEMPDFGTFRSGHISFQDHGDPVWYRNIKIREIK